MTWLAALLRWTWIGGMIFGATIIVVGSIGAVVVNVIVEDDPMRVALADDSVYVDKSAQKILDADAARRVVGDRSIVVVAVAGADNPAGTCELAVWDRSLALGIVYSDVTAPAVCAGRFAELPDTMTGTGWAAQIHLAGQFARMDEPYSAITDLTAFVAAYDTAVDADLRYGRPPRAVEDRTGSWKDVAWVLAGLAFVAWCVFANIAEGGQRIAHWRDRRRRRRVVRAELQAEMASVAAALSGGPALSREPALPGGLSGEGFERAVQRYRWAEESSAEHPEMARIWVRQAREALDGEAR